MPNRTLRRHYVTFYSPGTFVAETTTREIFAWDIERAMQMATEVTERWNAKPYGFVFTTRERGPDDFDSREVARSGIHYLPHCRVRTVDEVRREAKPDERILLGNMERNGWDRIVTTTEGWTWSQPIREGDVVLGEDNAD